MAKAPQKKKQEQIETEPDAWDRFTKAVKKVERKSSPPAKKSGGRGKGRQT